MDLEGTDYSAMTWKSKVQVVWFGFSRCKNDRGLCVGMLKIEIGAADDGLINIDVNIRNV